MCHTLSAVAPNMLVTTALDIDKSTASEPIRRAVGRLLGQFLLGREN